MRIFANRVFQCNITLRCRHFPGNNLFFQVIKTVFHERCEFSLPVVGNVPLPILPSAKPHMGLAFKENLY